MNGSVWWGNARGGRERRPGGGQMGYRMASVKRSEPKIHLPQLINEEAIADEFSECQQVSCPPAERRMNLPPPPLPPFPAGWLSERHTGCACGGRVIRW